MMLKLIDLFFLIGEKFQHLNLDPDGIPNTDPDSGSATLASFCFKILFEQFIFEVSKFFSFLFYRENVPVPLLGYGNWFSPFFSPLFFS